MLADPGNAIAEQYGLTWTFSDAFRELYLGFGIDLAEYNGDDTWRLPMPARFVVDSDKVIRYPGSSVVLALRARKVVTASRRGRASWRTIRSGNTNKTG